MNSLPLSQEISDDREGSWPQVRAGRYISPSVLTQPSNNNIVRRNYIFAHM